MKGIHIRPWSWLYVACFLDLLGASMIMPVFSSHLRSLGLSHASVGLLSSMYGVTQLLAGPIVGSWSDIYGRSSILVLSLVICSIAYFLMGIVSSFFMFCIVRCFLGTFKHTQTLCRAFVADIVSSVEQPAVHGLLNAFTSFSFMIGPLVSGHVMEMENGFQCLTTAVSLIFILNAALVFSFAQNSHTTKVGGNLNEIKKKYQSNFAKFSPVFTELYSIEWKRFWMLFCIKFTFALSGILYFQNLGVILTEIFEVSPRFMGYTISFYGFVSVLCNLGVGKIVNLGILPKTHLDSVTCTLGLMTVTFCVLYLVDNYILFVMGLIPLAAGHSLTRILLTEVLLERSDSSCRGSLVGASSSTVSIARTFTPFISGLLIGWGGISFALLASAVTSAFACFLTVVYSRQPLSKNLIKNS